MDEVPPASPGAARRAGAVFGRAAGGAAREARATIRRHPAADRVYRTGVGVVGGSTVALGVVLMPLPGPGTLIALGGLGILASEFEGARRVSHRADAAARKAFAAAKETHDRRRERRQGPEGPAPHPRRPG